MTSASKTIRKVVIPVAGLGTRGLPFTKEVPKELTPILDTPTIHFIVDEAIRAGIETVIFVTGRGKVALEDYFDYSPTLENWLRKRGKDAAADNLKRVGSLVEIISVRQKAPLGLGHAVYCARHAVGNEPFAVCLGDEIYPDWDAADAKSPFLRRVVDEATATSKSVVGVVEIPASDSLSYGMVDLGGKNLARESVPILRTVEKPKPENAPSQYAIIGRYAFQAELFAALADTQPGVGGEIQLTDAMDKLCRSQSLRALLAICRRYDVGNAFYFLQATIDAALRRPELEPRLRQYLKSL